MKISNFLVILYYIRGDNTRDILNKNSLLLGLLLLTAGIANNMQVKFN